MDFIIAENINDAVSVITLNHPKRLNVLSRKLIEELNSALSDLDYNPNVKCVILTGIGKAFSAGADLSEIYQTSSDHLIKEDYPKEWQKIAEFSKPLIAAVQGLALGGGLEIALMTDIIIACENAQLAQPEITLGLIPGGGGTQRLLQVIGQKRVMEMCLTGRRISAQEALQWGLINKVVSLTDLMDTALETANHIASFSLPALRLLKSAIKISEKNMLQKGLAEERNLFHQSLLTKEVKENLKNFFNSK